MYENGTDGPSHFHVEHKRSINDPSYTSLSDLSAFHFLQNGKKGWSDGNPMNFHMFNTNRSSSIVVYEDILKFFWFTQLYGQDDSCQFESWDETTCLSNHDKLDFCGFKDWNAKFCFDSYNITMKKLLFIKNLLNQPYAWKNGRQCTLMVVLLPHVHDIMWISIPCNEKILDNATVYCAKKDSRYYSSFNQMSESPQTVVNMGEILYKCKDSSFVSSYFLFDNIQDCSENEDETDIIFTSMNETDTHGSTLMVSPSRLCDAIAHSNLKNYLTVCLHRSSFSSLDRNRIPKLQKNNHCLFILGYNATLIPYSNGQHLTKCKKYACHHTYYKCPGFYCIPWQYVCNHRVDCPGGLDERLCDRQRNTCAKQLRCRDSAVCIALENICDGVDDCLLQEDEYFCDIFPQRCPLNCMCLLFVIECSGWRPVVTHELKTELKFPYVKISIRVANISDVLSFLQQFHQVVELKFHDTLIFDICQKWEQFTGNFFMRVLSLSFNDLTVLSRNCFSDMQLRFLNLSFNDIYYVEKYSFENSEHLIILDLSFNKISYLFPHIFSIKLYMKLLDLHGNLITNVFPDFFNDNF